LGKDLRLVAFDMDGTLLNGRVIFALAERWGFKKQVTNIMKSGLAEYRQSAKIAELLKGFRDQEVADVIRRIPLTTGAEETVAEIKSRGWITGILSDSYTLATDYLKGRLHMDFHAANELEEKDGVLTGRLHMPLGWSESGCACHRSICKSYHLKLFADHFNIPLSQTIAVGDNTSDICALKAAGLGVAFDPKLPEVSSSSDVTIKKPDLRELLKYL
jgi:phosphoserine phosphatase SerB